MQARKRIRVAVEERVAGIGSARQRALNLAAAPATVLDVRGARPLEALQRLREAVPTDPMARKEWFAKARVAAIMGSCPKSRESFAAGASFFLGAMSARFLFVLRSQGLGTGVSLQRFSTETATQDSHHASMGC